MRSTTIHLMALNRLAAPTPMMAAEMLWVVETGMPSREARAMTVAELASASQSVVLVVTRPGSEVIARIGAGKLLAGKTVSVEALDANYLRRSDAEIFFKGNR